MTITAQRRAHGRGARPPRTIEPMAAPGTPAAARRAWERLEIAGGVITRSELQQSWQMTRQRAHQVTTGAEFPAPVIEGTNGHAALWLTADVEQWRRTWTPPSGPSSERPPLLDTDPDPAAARRAWRQVEQTGGLVTVEGLAVEWGISVRGALKRTAQPTFPDDVTPGRWLNAEALAIHPS